MELGGSSTEGVSQADCCRVNDLADGNGPTKQGGTPPSELVPTWTTTHSVMEGS